MLYGADKWHYKRPMWPEPGQEWGIASPWEKSSIAEHYRALRPSQGIAPFQGGQDVSVKFLQATWLFLFALFRNEFKQRAIAAQALQWFKEMARGWQNSSWYATIYRQLQQQCQASKLHDGNKGHSAFSFQTQGQSPMVDEAEQEPRGIKFNKTRCLSSSSPSPQIIKQALHQIQGGNQNGIRYFARLPFSRDSK